MGHQRVAGTVRSKRPPAWRRAGSVIAVATVALALLFSLAMSGHRSADVSYRPRAAPRTAASYRSAGPSCVNVWMGGNPDDPHACRPAPVG